MHLKAVLRVLVLLPGLSLSTAALAQSAQQVLDTIVTYGAKKVYEMDLKAAPAKDIALDAPVDSDLKACKLTANRGLFCINAAKEVVNWKNPDSDELGDVLFNCTKIAEFDPKSSETCTAITLDPAGNIWLAGKNKGKTHSLVKVGLCSDGQYCLDTEHTKLWATGRPLLLDIEYIGGEAADAFTFGPNDALLGEGILGLQERKTVVFFPDLDTAGRGTPVLQPAEITEISSGKTGWGLIGNEQLQGVTLLQPATMVDSNGDEVIDEDGNPVPYEDDHVLVVTSTGRIIAMNTRTLLPEEIGREDSCISRSSKFGARASAKTGRVYTTSGYVEGSTFCGRFTAWQPKVTQLTSGPKLTMAKATDEDGKLFVADLDVAPEGPTIAPGIGVDLNDPACQAGCPITVGATLRIGNALASEESGLVVFQVKNIPDCRWNDTKACREAAATAAANPAERDKAVILDLNGDGDDFVGTSDHPAVGDPQVASKQYLNVTPLLPSEITDLFTGNDELPPLLISPQYRGQNGVFEAFFYVTEEGVRFFGTFDAEYDVALLAGGSFECKYPGYPNAVSLPGEVLTDREKLDYLLGWDVATRVSEDFISVGGPGSEDHVNTLINTGCGSIVTKKPGFSLVPYNLEITPHTYCDAVKGGVEVIENNDAVFARLLQKLYKDLGTTLSDLAHTTYDVLNDDDPGNDSSNPPLSDGDHSALRVAYDDSQLKLDRCIEATYQPKTSAGAQNCQSFLSQFKKFTDLLDWAVPSGDDPANRIGELQARVAVILHLYETRFIPSVPDGGFSVEAGVCE